MEQDTDARALQGKLGKCEALVRQAFTRVDALVFEMFGAVDRKAIRRNGEWVGRSYWVAGRHVLRVDPKSAFLRIKTGRDVYATAPEVLKGKYRQDDWIIVRPSDIDVAIDALVPLLRSHTESDIRPG